MPTTTTHCLECHAPLSGAEAQGLCARCLLKLGLATPFGETSIADAGARKIIPPPLFPFDFGGYRVLRLLGRGGMGAVYEAEQKETRRRVALKVLGQTIDSPEMRKRFLREGRLAASVNHPNTVYIFGTEEIEGAPVIAMELVAGGTLRDQLTRGPLAVRDAVDATLQIISGLEAAAAAGVLHRDVKPANCFIGPDGTIKVGDFGLSVSTLAHHDSQLTASGVLLGTPSFAPPEQLRGDELDLRADIYSVGATLYALLTGRPPFTGDNAVQVVAAVLDQSPPPVAEFRHDLPPGLAQIVGKCLAKKREDRFTSYAALRDALTPFCSQALEQAPLGLRFVAGVVDCLAVSLLTAFAHQLIIDQGEIAFAVTRLAGFYQLLAVLFFNGLYFALPEGLWGASIGKTLCGLRVVGPERAGPGLRLAGWRTLIVALAANVSLFVLILFPSWEKVAQIDVYHFATAAVNVDILTFFLLFCTMRRANGFAAIHDLLTRTRVVLRPKASERPALRNTSAAGQTDRRAENPDRLGPFILTGSPAAGWLGGYDEVLRRNIWIRSYDTPIAPMSPLRRELSRIGRLRWIAGARSAAANWDAFDAPAGQSLLAATAKPQPWSAVRFWLHDLAEELDAASKDATLPPQIGLDQVWISADGRAVLLDEPFPAAGSAERFACAHLADAPRFLTSVAQASLDSSGLPLHARAFLSNLAAGKLDRTSFIAGNLRSLLTKNASVTGATRFASLALVPTLSLVLAAFIFLTWAVGMRYFANGWTSSPRLLRMRTAIALNSVGHGGNLQGQVVPIPVPLRPDARTTESAAIYLAGHYGEALKDGEFDQLRVRARQRDWERGVLSAAIAKYPKPSPEQVAAADKVIEPIAKDQTTVLRLMKFFFIPVVFFMCMSLAGIANLLSILVFRTTASLRAFGLAIVNRAGEPASRWRLLARTAVVWLPWIVAWSVFLNLKMHGHGPFRFAIVIASILIFLAGTVWSLLRPTRGPHDLLAGTHLAPR